MYRIYGVYPDKIGDRFKWDCGLGQTNLENLNKIKVHTIKNATNYNEKIYE